MVKIPNMLIENEDYELIPGDGEHWHIRIKTGEYIESVLSFGQIKIDQQNDTMKFDFTLHYSPDPDLTIEDYDLQKYAAKVLESVIINSLNDAENK